MAKRSLQGLEEIVREYHHLLEEHRRTGPESTARRHLHAHLDELEHRFERLIGETVAGESERVAWRARLHHGAEAPPSAPARPLAFKGRSEAGSVVEIRERPDGDFDVEIDGVPIDRLGDHIDFHVYVDGDREYPEVFDAPPAAREALAAWVADPAGEPPWEHAHDLLDDGLIDRYFGLTDRGRRAVHGRTG
jgi:hypothetical protein